MTICAHHRIESPDFGGTWTCIDCGDPVTLAPPSDHAPATEDVDALEVYGVDPKATGDPPRVARVAERESTAKIIADALYRHRYPRAMTGVEPRGHPSHDRIWREADAVADALAKAAGIPF